MCILYAVRIRSISRGEPRSPSCLRCLLTGTIGKGEQYVDRRHGRAYGFARVLALDSIIFRAVAYTARRLHYSTRSGTHRTFVSDMACNCKVSTIGML